ncbi:aldehyde dehydrogenase family protein [Neobacillus sp. SM06]|uniref:aldehyde dehydrogenase family protein n=1 Tax=Neobacillus sp. SM06 TaxID=3422492 RepID=UPI003D29B885
METKGLFLNGKWMLKERTYPLYAPYSGEQLAEISKADANDVEEAIQSAHQAFQELREIPAYKRAEILYRVAELVKKNKEELAKIIALEAGKPIRAARAEIDRTVATYQFAGEEAKRIYGETVPMDAAPGGENRLGMTWREPLGVVAAITPFNFPFNLVAHKLGPAFAVGNTVVLKPANQTPLSALKIAEIFQQAGLPDGALQVVTGSGSELGDILATHPLIKKVTFTGSPEVGKEIKAKAGLRKVTLELGSNSAVIVEPAANLEPILARCVEGAYAYAGQVCISLQRIFIHESIYGEFSKRFSQLTSQVKVGDPLDEETMVSAMIHAKEAERIESWVAEAVGEGAKIASGGKRSGASFAPTALVNVSKNMKVCCQEVFAPVVTMIPYQNLDQAISLVNDSNYGLNVGIFTEDINKALYAAKKIESGGIIINDIPTFRVDHMPYGGVKESGYGREGIKYAVEEMTELKFVTIKTSI